MKLSHNIKEVFFKFFFLNLSWNLSKEIKSCLTTYIYCTNNSLVETKTDINEQTTND